jgi:two-component system C4-dicarboxylate transport response regulator DctD
MAEAAPDEQQSMISEGMNDLAASPSGRQPTILLVDDHPSVRLIISAGIKAQGFNVLTAATAEKAMALCEAFDGVIDLMLADIGLTPPELWPTHIDDSIPHGIALAERAIRIRPHLQVILFTGYSDDRLARLGPDLQRFTLLRKPCGLPTLIHTFRRLLDKPGQQSDSNLTHS